MAAVFIGLLCGAAEAGPGERTFQASLTIVARCSVANGVSTAGAAPGPRVHCNGRTPRLVESAWHRNVVVPVYDPETHSVDDPGIPINAQVTTVTF